MSKRHGSCLSFGLHSVALALVATVFAISRAPLCKGPYYLNNGPARPGRTVRGICLVRRDQLALPASWRAAVEARRTMCAALHAIVGRHDAAAGLDLAAEVRRVEALVQDHFVDLTELRQREVPGQELKRHVRVTDLVAQPPQRVPKDLVVVEG